MKYESNLVKFEQEVAEVGCYELNQDSAFQLDEKMNDNVDKNPRKEMVIQC